MSPLDKKLLVYTLDGRKQTAVKHLPMLFVHVARLKDGYIGFMGNMVDDKKVPFNFWLKDKELAIRGHAQEIDEDKAGVYHASVYPFSAYDGHTYFFQDGGRDVYDVEAGTPVPSMYYTVDFGEKNAPELTAKDVNDFQKMFEFSNKYVMDIYRFQETAHHLLLLFLYQVQSYICAYDKDAKTGKTLSLDTYTGDYFFGFGNVVNMTQDKIYTVLGA